MAILQIFLKKSFSKFSVQETPLRNHFLSLQVTQKLLRRRHDFFSFLIITTRTYQKFPETNSLSPSRLRINQGVVQQILLPSPVFIICSRGTRTDASTSLQIGPMWFDIGVAKQEEINFGGHINFQEINFFFQIYVPLDLIGRLIFRMLMIWCNGLHRLPNIFATQTLMRQVRIYRQISLKMLITRKVLLPRKAQAFSIVLSGKGLVTTVIPPLNKPLQNSSSNVKLILQTNISNLTKDSN